MRHAPSPEPGSAPDNGRIAVVAPLYPVEQRTPQGNLLQRYPLLLTMQNGAEDDTAAITLQDAREGYQKSISICPQRSGNGT